MRRLGEDGFTAQEALAVCALFILIIVPSLLLIHPKNYGPQLRNAERRVAIAATMQDIHAYVRATGSLPSGISNKPEVIGTGTNQINLCKDLSPTYMKVQPTDPFLGGYVNCASSPTYETGLAIQRTGKGMQVTILSIGSEGALVSFTD